MERLRLIGPEFVGEHGAARAGPFAPVCSEPLLVPLHLAQITFLPSFCFFPLTLSPTLSHFSSWTCSHIHSHLTTSPLLPPSLPSCPSPQCPAPSNLLHAFSQPQYFLLYPLRGLFFFFQISQFGLVSATAYKDKKKDNGPNQTWGSWHTTTEVLELFTKKSWNKFFNMENATIFSLRSVSGSVE